MACKGDVDNVDEWRRRRRRKSFLGACPEQEEEEDEDCNHADSALPSDYRTMVAL